MISRYIRSKWVIGIIMLLTIVGITLVTVPWNHAPSAKAATNDQTQHCDDQPSTHISPQGYAYYPCPSIGLGSKCLNVHSSPSTDPATVITCATSYPYQDGYFYVMCQTAGDEVEGISNFWDELVPQNGAQTAAYVSDYYIATANVATLSTNIPNCSDVGFSPQGTRNV